MKGSRKWNDPLKYTLGILVFVEVMVLSWFLPGWYAKWQDELLLGKVQVSKRENIEFIDVDVLDMARRMKMLNEASNITWSVEGGSIYGSEGVIERCQMEMEKWCESGLLFGPADSWSLIRIFDGRRIYMDQGTIPVCVLQLKNETYQDSLLTIVMDRELGAIYYAAVTGSAFAEDMAQRMGFSSGGEFWEWNKSGGDEFRKEDLSGYDFASVCGAEAAEIVEKDASDLFETGQYVYEFDVRLKFPEFEAYAYRQNTGYGMESGSAIMYGSLFWEEFVWDTLNMYGVDKWGSAEAIVDDTKMMQK